MFDVTVNNAVNQETNDHYKYIDENLENTYRFPLTFDAIFFSSVTSTGNENFYKLFVRLNLLDNTFFGDDEYRQMTVIGGTSHAEFSIANSSGVTALKTIDGNSSVIFDPTVISAYFHIAPTPKFYGLKIPKAYFKWGEVNNIRFNAEIHGTDGAAQTFQGSIMINGLNKIEKNQQGDNTMVVTRENQVEAFINFNPFFLKTYGAIDLLMTQYEIDDLSTYNNNLFYENYDLKKQSELMVTWWFKFDENIMRYLEMERDSISSIGNITHSNSFDINSSTGDKISAYYDFTKNNNSFIPISSNHYQIKNDDYTILDVNSNKVKLANDGNNKGIVVNPNLKVGLIFTDNVGYNDFDFTITNKVSVNNNTFSLVSDDDIDISELLISYQLNVTQDEIKNFNVDQMKGYVSDREKKNY